MLYKVVDEEQMYQVENLWDYCFEKKDEPFFKYYFNEYCGFKNTVIGGFEQFDEDLSLQTMLHLNPYTLTIRGKEMVVPYVVGVATAPEARGQHLMGGLLKSSFKVLRKQGIDFVTLMPIYAGIYLPYEFSFCYFRQKYSWETGKLSLLKLGLVAKKLSVMHLDWVDSEAVAKYGELDLGQEQAYKEIAEQFGNGEATARPKLYHEDVEQLLSYMYEEFTQGLNGVPKRTQEQWEKLLSVHALEGTKCAMVHLEGEPQGYMLYSIQNETFYIHEMLTKNSMVEQRLLKYADMHVSEAKRVEWLAPAWNKTYLSLRDASQAPQLVPFMMARCLNPKAALAKLTAEQGLQGSVVLQIFDSLLEENEQTLSLQWSNGELKVEETNSKGDIILDAAAFTQLYFGAFTATELWEAGKLVCNDVSKLKALDELLPKTRNWINEYF